MAETTTRDVNNHVLFEVATEVANRGTLLLRRSFQQHWLTWYSWWNLLGAQVEGAGNHSRVWRIIHTHWTMEQGIGMFKQAPTGGWN
jgi:hypothetical protein